MFPYDLDSTAKHEMLYCGPPHITRSIRQLLRIEPIGVRFGLLYAGLQLADNHIKTDKLGHSP
jgi:hypothetical protein